MLDFCIPLHKSGKLPFPTNVPKYIVFSIHSSFVTFLSIAMNLLGSHLK